MSYWKSKNVNSPFLQKGGKQEKNVDGKGDRKVDPDAPGTPGKPGYEPPVRRSDFEEGSEQQKMFDRNQAKARMKKSPSGRASFPQKSK